MQQVTKSIRRDSDGWKAQVALIRAKMEAVVTLSLLLASLFIILTGSSNQQWAIGIVGIICGYWLRPHK
jgi:hypothetical protein